MRTVITGIDIGTYAIRVVVCAIDPNQPFPKVIGVGHAPTNGVRHGYVANKSQVLKSLRQAVKLAEQASKTPIKQAYVSFGGISLSSQIVINSTVISRADGEISAGEVAQLTEGAEDLITEKYRNRQILHSEVIEYRIDGKPTYGDPTGLHGTRLEAKIICITGLEHHINDLMAVVSAAGITPMDLIIPSLAISDLVLDPRQRNVGAILLDIGAETTTMSVFENNALIGLNVFPLGSNHITNDIALGFRIPLEEAEQVKTGAADRVSMSRKKIDEIVQARLTDVFELVSSQLKKMGKRGLLAGGIVITGGGSTLTSIEEFAKLSLEIPASVAHVELLPAARRFLPDSSWMVAYGLCNRATQQSHASHSSWRVPGAGKFVATIIARAKKALGSILP